jgi:hypothetical protein
LSQIECFARGTAFAFHLVVDIQTIFQRCYTMKLLKSGMKRLGDVKWGLIAMLLGLPVPLVILFFLCGGCGGSH